MDTAGDEVPPARSLSSAELNIFGTKAKFNTFKWTENDLGGCPVPKGFTCLAHGRRVFSFLITQNKGLFITITVLLIDSLAESCMIYGILEMKIMALLFGHINTSTQKSTCNLWLRRGITLWQKISSLGSTAFQYQRLCEFYNKTKRF